jgi:hypothetical protein
LENYVRGEDRTLPETEANNPLQNAISRETKDERADLRSRVAELQTTLAQSEKRPSALKKEWNTLLKLVIGMAIKGYGYDPTEPRSGKPKEIAQDLHGLGIPIDEDTVRTWLKKGYEEFGDETMRKRLNETF